MRQRLIPSLLLCLAGCALSFAPIDEHYDSDLALETLNSALEAWKEGNVKVLISLDSPIRFTDDDLFAGFRLVDYEMIPPTVIRPFQNVPVTLTLVKGNGSPVERAAVYQISLEPDRAVLRSDP